MHACQDCVLTVHSSMVTTKWEHRSDVYAFQWRTDKAGTTCGCFNMSLDRECDSSSSHSLSKEWVPTGCKACLYWNTIDRVPTIEENSVRGQIMHKHDWKKIKRQPEVLRASGTQGTWFCFLGAGQSEKAYGEVNTSVEPWGRSGVMKYRRGKWDVGRLSQQHEYRGQKSWTSELGIYKRWLVSDINQGGNICF